MKIFVDPEENFVIQIPEDWYFTTSHNNDDKLKQPFGFEPYEKRNFAFLVSCRKVEPEIKVSVDKQPIGKTNLEFMFLEQKGISAWITELEGGYTAMITFSYSNKLDKKDYNKEIKLVKDSVKSFMFLDEISKKKILPRVRWDNFMISYVSSLDLSNRAYKNRSNIELVILLANQIDSAFRQMIILNKQLINNNDEIEEALIFQKENDKPIFEKAIYKRALDDKLMTTEEYNNLIEMYNLRNKVVHRYIISDLRTIEITKLVFRYSEIYDQLSDKLIEIEQMQFKKQIGINAGDIAPGSDVSKGTIKTLVSLIRDKHGDRVINKEITIG